MVLCGTILFRSTATSADIAGWLSADNPVLSDPSLLSDNTPNPPTVTGYGNIDCFEHTFVTKPAKLVLLQDEESHVGCGIQTKYGVGGGGWVQLNGTQTAGRITNFAGNPMSNVWFVPDSSTLITSNSSQGSFKLFFYENFQQILTPEVAITGEVKYKLPQSGPTKTLESADGTDLFVTPSTIGFSNNGKWMVLNSPSGAVIRVNMATYEVVPFRNDFTYHLGSDPQVHTAISDDGVYALTSTGGGGFDITDVSSCAPVPANITEPVDCNRKTLDSFIRQSTVGYRSTRYLRFIGNDLVTMRVLHQNEAGDNVSSKYRMAPPGGSIESVDYLALGDSFASGEGAYNYFEETDTDENRCHLSRDSYPYLIGQTLNLDSYNSVACSGAVMYNISHDPQYINIPHPNNLGGLLPGFRKQLHYVKKLEPDVVTVGIGGNDIGFGEIVYSCTGFLAVVPGTCYPAYEDRYELAQKVRTQYGKLIATLESLKLSVKPETKIYIFGYPKLAQIDGNCAVNVRFNNEEIRFSNHLIDYLNNIINLAADRAGIQYVNVSDVFSGHKLCETKTEKTAVLGLTAGNDRPFLHVGPIGAESYHPNKLGHQLFKDKIIEETESFMTSMPAPNEDLWPAEITDELPLLQNVPKTNRSMRNIDFNDGMTSDMSTRGSLTSVVIDASKYMFKRLANFKIELHSEPIDLGTFTTDENGGLAADVTIPNSVEPGFHAIHVIGENIAGEAVDIQKTIYIKHSEEDFDGDGVLNDVDTCPTFEQSGKDKDKDDIDDACDGFIDKAPPRPSIAGKVFHDLNGDGKRNSTDPFVNGWTINLYDKSWNLTQTRTTGVERPVEGGFSFMKLKFGAYRVCLANQTGYAQTRPFAHLLTNNPNVKSVVNKSPNSHNESRHCWQARLLNTGILNDRRARFTFGVSQQ